jgi:hypothetical protein
MTNGPDDGGLLFVIARVLLAIALVGGLVMAGRSVYRRLPADDEVKQISIARDAGMTGSRLVIRNRITSGTLHSPLELYNFNLSAAQREYEESPKLARQFDDFLVRRMHDVSAVKADVNGEGFATAQLTSGDWWLRATATLDSGEEIEWRLPVAIKDRDQAIELSLENAYERRKKF